MVQGIICTFNLIGGDILRLTTTLVRELKKDKQWILTMLSHAEILTISVELRNEPGEILITLLMKQPEIEKAVHEATKEVFGGNVIATNISVESGGKVIKITLLVIVKRCILEKMRFNEIKREIIR